MWRNKNGRGGEAGGGDSDSLSSPGGQQGDGLPWPLTAIHTGTPRDDLRR